VIEVRNLRKQFGDIVAIDDICFTVEPGEVCAFLGPNGAGKTTTMRILTGFIAATSGTVRVAGFDVFESPMEVKRRVGYLPETPPLYPEMTVLEYLAFVAAIKGVPRREIKAAIDVAVEKVTLGEVSGRLIANLSKGYRQRVGLAHAIIHNPPVLILDEPTVGLDPKQIIEIRELIKGLAGEHTIILSTHILPEATAVCQKVVIVNHGKVVAVDTPEGLSAQVRQSETLSVRVRRIESVASEKIQAIGGTLVLQEASPKEGEGRFLVEVGRGIDLREALAKTIVEEGWGLLEMKPMALSLEEVFLQLTTEEKGGAVHELPSPELSLSGSVS